MPPPFLGQWESRELIGAILREETRAADDPLWARSGARHAAEYERWSWHLCGTACLRMALAGLGIAPPPLLELARALVRHGGYVEEENGWIRGLIYAGAVALLEERYGIGAEIVLDSPTEAIPALLARGAAYIASVHPAIRSPAAEPPSRGGHLVLVFAAEDGAVRFHNPSGDTRATQEDVRMALPDFARFHAERGILVLGRGER
ncbi:MAG TPA: hypothetical protein VD970_02920 [Acetobacteraceae bacterium]|nr:hypothetical protein [Acetobacteraceae bacterium]